MGQMMMCTPYMSNYYLCESFIENLDNEKNWEKWWGKMMMCTSCMLRDML
jgi:hypothetical protein